jgi:alpha-1,2-mannosyltransferase
VTLGIAAAIAFRPRTWPAFVTTLVNLNSSLSPRAGVEISLDSVYGLLHWAGIGTSLAWTVYLAVALSPALAVHSIWAQPTVYALKAATLCLGSLLVTPYVLRYDLCILSIAAAFLVKDGLSRGFLAGERTIMLLCLVGLYCPSAPVGPIVCAALLLLVFRRKARIPGALPAAPRQAMLGGALT